MKDKITDILKLNNNDFLNSKNKFKYPEVRNVLQMLAEHGSEISWVNEFEKRFSEKFGVKHSIACNSGTSGLHAALFAAGVKKGDEVILPALTVIMDAYVIMHLGAIPIFADVYQDTHLISVEDISKKITARTKAIITVSWEGLSCDMDPIMTIANKHNIIVIDDSARTVLGYYKGKKAGTIADISVFSFEAKKHMTSGSEGGMIVTNNEQLAIKARKFAGIGYRHLTADAGRTHLAIDTVQDPSYLRFDTMGLNYRMNDVSAAVGLGQLERIDEIVDLRKHIGEMYLNSIGNCKWLIPQHTPDDYVHSYYTFSAEYRGDDFYGITWKEFYYRFKELGGDGFYSVVAIPYLEPPLIGKVIGDVKMEIGLCPVSELLQKRVMCFKTNYRDIKTAQKQVEILSKLIYKIENS